jgi:CRISPR-associated protein Cas1
MQLVINTYGAYLRKSGNCFLVRRDEKSFEVAAAKVNSILITTAAYVTTDAIKLAVDNNIDIVFLDAHGDPYGRVWHPKLGSTTLIRRDSWRFTRAWTDSICPGVGPQEAGQSD